MPRVEFVMPTRNLRITKSMPSPKRITELQAWLKQCRKVIPQIPDTHSTDWYVANEEATIKYITFTLHSGIGERAYVTIDREKSFMTG